LYPGIAVAERFARKMPLRSCIFLCTQKEIDRVILEAAGFSIHPAADRPAGAHDRRGS
jgi:hypothetical protein